MNQHSLNSTFLWNKINMVHCPCSGILAFICLYTGQKKLKQGDKYAGT